MQHKIVNMLDPHSHHNPQPKKSSSSGTLNMIPPWNIHTVKQYAKELLQWLFFELVHSLRILSILPTFKLASLTKECRLKSSIWSGFEIKNWIEDQFQSIPKLVGIWTVLRCMFVSNLDDIVTSIGGELLHGQAQNGVNFDFGVQFDLEGQDRLPPKTIGT